MDRDVTSWQLVSGLWRHVRKAIGEMHDLVVGLLSRLGTIASPFFMLKMSELFSNRNIDELVEGDTLFL